ncbi:thioredoxin domain-containing protein [Mycoplasmoides gallisepticum]|uniref:Thioredoxin n=5 Tax=Mycoplasmoides gallisepticum TaxID=2096 RepID=Q7NC24_MYCGA|nr:thioredoxin domain-containing protein [Mycoplasmoides gallisepticum]AAP56435.1 thioredoxin [Mycoplasmoides gallisepticum str. R(low)]ADC30267.1 thioredoxin [Mycoplasmoides gallisepticum str. R(high)]ADC31033.1 thioredoxin [Mycoplasmoides gallisepticum str. F]AHB99408.1 thioredoxin [Mycoplasmoides gallisepticum S6]OBU78349.1 thiol reductase thioredoxin [Mycoplasmoides gallisepticum]
MKSISLKELEQVIQTSKKPIFVKFSWADCGVCKMNAPIIENAANQRKDQYDWYEIDVDKEQIWAEDQPNHQWAIKIVPVYMIFKNKQKVFEHVNFLAQDKLNTELDKHI